MRLLDDPFYRRAAGRLKTFRQTLPAEDHVFYNLIVSRVERMDECPQKLEHGLAFMFVVEYECDWLDTLPIKNPYAVGGFYPTSELASIIFAAVSEDDLWWRNTFLMTPGDEITSEIAHWNAALSIS